MGTDAVPSKDAVEYGRARIAHEIAWVERMGEQARANGRDDAKWRFAAFVLGRMLGHGCVVGPFDERWLDEEFRQMIGVGGASPTP